MHAHYVLACFAHISDKHFWIRKIKVSMESGEQNLTQARKQAYMHPMRLGAQAHISAKLDRIREIKVSMESG